MKTSEINKNPKFAEFIVMNLHSFFVRFSAHNIINHFKKFIISHTKRKKSGKNTPVFGISEMFKYHETSSLIRKKQKRRNKNE